MGILWHERAHERGLRALTSAKRHRSNTKGHTYEQKGQTSQASEKNHEKGIYMT